LIKLAVDSFVVCFQRGIEPQNTEQGIMNVEVLKNKNTSYLYIPCSTCPPSRAAQARRAGIRYSKKPELVELYMAEGVGHSDSIQTSGYEGALKSFLDRHLSNN
jgi:hypothetical protein